MGKLIGTLLVLGLVGVAAEVAAPRLVERVTTQQVAAQVDAAEVVTTAGDVPFLPPLLGDGVIGSLAVELRGIDTSPLPLRGVTLAVDDLEVSRSALLRGEIVVRDIAGGEVTATADVTDLTAALGVSTDDLPEAVRDRVDLEALLGDIDVAVEDVPVPGSLVPCAPDLRIDAGTATLACSFDEIPAVLRDTARG